MLDAQQRARLLHHRTAGLDERPPVQAPRRDHLVDDGAHKEVGHVARGQRAVDLELRHLLEDAREAVHDVFTGHELFGHQLHEQLRHHLALAVAPVQRHRDAALHELVVEPRLIALRHGVHELPLVPVPEERRDRRLDKRLERGEIPVELLRAARELGVCLRHLLLLLLLLGELLVLVVLLQVLLVVVHVVQGVTPRELALALAALRAGAGERDVLLLPRHAAVLLHDALPLLLDALL